MLQAEQQVVEIMLRAQSVHYPPTWQLPDDQTDNTQLYDVPLTSAEVSSLVQDVEAGGNKVLKVCHICCSIYHQLSLHRHSHVLKDTCSNMD